MCRTGKATAKKASSRIIAPPVAPITNVMLRFTVEGNRRFYSEPLPLAEFTKVLVLARLVHVISKNHKVPAAMALDELTYFEDIPEFDALAMAAVQMDAEDEFDVDLTTEFSPLTIGEAANIIWKAILAKEAVTAS